MMWAYPFFDMQQTEWPSGSIFTYEEVRYTHSYVISGKIIFKTGCGEFENKMAVPYFLYDFTDIRFEDKSDIPNKKTIAVVEKSILRCIGNWIVNPKTIIQKRYEQETVIPRQTYALVIGGQVKFSESGKTIIANDTTLIDRRNYDLVVTGNANVIEMQL